MAVSIAERGSFHRAAAHLNLSQTALSHRMKKLEDDLGVRLLTRTTRQVSLTPAGLDLLPRARRVLGELAETFDDIRRHGRAENETLALGCLPTIAVHYLPPLLARFAAKHPEINVRIFDNSAAEIAAHVEAGRAEFGITIVSANRWDLEVVSLLKEPFVLVCPATHPLAARPSVSWSEIESERLVRISAQTGNRTLIDDALGSRREGLHWVYECQHLATAVSMVLAGAGLTIVPRLAIDAMASPALAAIPLRNPGLTRTLGVVTKRGAPLTRPAEALLDLISRQMKADAKRPAIAAQGA